MKFLKGFCSFILQVALVVFLILLGFSFALKDTLVDLIYDQVIKKEITNNVLGHAELLAITKACKKLNSWRLNGCEMYVTLEPCSMCLSALIHARIDKIYFGCIDPKSGALGGAFDLQSLGKFNHHIEYECIGDTRCGNILKDYFKSKRELKK
jgi:tRNA(adenine34) deaminase